MDVVRIGIGVATIADIGALQSARAFAAEREHWMGRGGSFIGCPAADGVRVVAPAVGVSPALCFRQVRVAVGNEWGKSCQHTYLRLGAMDTVLFKPIPSVPPRSAAQVSQFRSGL
jgi:hypothetical protein